jgi:diguanylate cyclase (GGDEF)-like protein
VRSSRPPARGTPPWGLRVDSVTTPPRVLIADDDRANRERVAQLLRTQGMEVEVIESGKAAIDRVSRGGVDLVMMDVVMPGLSGIDCCRLIKTMTADTFLPVMLVTGKSETESRVEGLRIGADDYVCKPFDDRELLARVNGMLRIKRLHDHVQESRARLEQLSVVDELTGLYNYRYLHSRLAEEYKRAERYHEPLACAMIDVDHFKRVNDTHGHDVGDAVLREVGTRLKTGLREIDVVARYGGEEFMLVLPGTHSPGAIVVADRLWRAVSEAPITVGKASLHVTVSIGIACYPSRDVNSKDELLKAADVALYQAKSEGRDRVCVYQYEGHFHRPPRGVRESRS